MVNYSLCQYIMSEIVCSGRKRRVLEIQRCRKKCFDIENCGLKMDHCADVRLFHGIFDQNWLVFLIFS